MDLKALEDLFAPEVTVSHRGVDYALRAPSLPEATEVAARFGEEASKLPEGADGRVPYLAAMARAVALTLDVEGGPVDDALARRIVLGTGGVSSTVGRAAARLCGLPLVGGEEVPDHLPT